MALQTGIPAMVPSAQVVANAFMVQYYHILHHNPETVYRFYQDSSVMSRPDAEGVMRSVTTMQGINDQILSFDNKEYKAEIETADAQNSYKDGVTVLITGCLTSKHSLKRKFAQSFFLAPQENGFFVLNDVFRYVEDPELQKNHSVNGVNDATAVIINQVSEPNHVPDPPAPDLETPQVEKHQNIVEKALDTSDQDRTSAIEKESGNDRPSYSNGDNVPIVVESAPSTAPEDGQKKSYASIVKVAKGSPGANKVYVPTNTVKVTPRKIADSLPSSAASASVPQTSAMTNSSTIESSETNEEAEGYSIYISNLPLNMTADQLEVEFKKFGSIKQGGIQVRNKKGYCFGFVEYESLSSMNNAVQASPITIGGLQAIIEMKKTNSRIGSSGSGSFSSGRGGFRSDSFRGHGNYDGTRSSVRNEYVNRDEFTGRGRGRGGRGGDSYRQKGTSHSHDETEPLRSSTNVDSECVSGGDKWNGSKEYLSRSSIKLSTKETTGFTVADTSSEEECPTCLQEYTPENPKIVTKCSHHYHIGCIYEWMERSESCPVCGKVMAFDETT